VAAAVLEDHKSDPVLKVLTALINSLSEDEQTELVAIMWLGRGDHSVGEQQMARKKAAC
jgi:hypothetical protein